MAFVSNFDLIRKRFLPSFISNFLFVLLIIFFLVALPSSVKAQLQINQAEDGSELVRSLESLRDLDYETWQVVVYKDEFIKQKVVLRIVGYPGTLRIDHPSSLRVESGRKSWNLKDITLENKQLASDPREAAAEFEVLPLLTDLTRNSPLRIRLPGVFNELPIPPYLVKEWRSIINSET